MAELSITFDEVLKELDRIANGSQEGFTVAQMSEATGYSMRWCREQLQRLVRAGKVVHVGRRRVPRIDGVGSLVPVYRNVHGE